MIWNAKIKTPKPEPVLGDKKEVVWFALFPVKVESKWLWLEKYIKIYEFKKYYYSYDVVVSSGLITEKYYTDIAEAIGWRKIGRKLLNIK